jgi:putative peptide zinc metalloprotease protein
MTETDYTWLTKIRLASITDDSGRVIVSGEAGPLVRTSGRVADILQRAILAYPNVDAIRIARDLGDTPKSVEDVLESIGALPALSRTARVSSKRVQFRKPFSIQLTLLDPSRILRAAPLLPILARTSAVWWGSLLLSVLGVLFLIAYMVSPDSSVHQPLSLSQYVGVFVGLFLSTLVHEFAHATVLVAYGGSSKRLGVMLFYLTPAFFCDVSDAWRFAPRVRVKVALAGVVAQCTVASIALIVGTFLKGETRETFVIFGVLCYIYALFNLVPLVKLDGYIALIGYMDRPNLRADAMAAVRGKCADILLLDGSRSKRRQEAPGFLLYGALCILFPVLLVAGVALSVNSYLSSWGNAGAWMTLVVFVLVAALGMVRAARIVVGVWRAGAARGRAMVFCAASSLVLLWGVIALPLPSTVSGGIFTVHGNPMFVVAGSTVSVLPGAQISVYSSSVFPSTRLGTAEVAGGPSACLVPLEAVTPMTGTNLRASAQCYPVSGLPRLPRTTVALLHSTSTTLADQFRFLANRLTRG